MIPIATLGLLAKGIVGGTQLIGGLSGLARNKRPKYKTPGAATSALGIAQEQANRMEMPGQSTMYGKIDQQGANMLEAAREYGMAGLASLPAIQAKMQGSKLDVGMQAAQWRDQKQAALQQALGTYAGYQDQEFQMNEFAPFKDKQQRSQNAIGAGAQNLIGGIDTYTMLSLLNKEEKKYNVDFSGAMDLQNMSQTSPAIGPSKWQSMLSIFKPK